MATITGTSTSYTYGSAGGNREDLEDVIWDLFPDETYCLTNLDRVTAEATNHEWLTDTLAAPAANRQLEGDDPTYAAVTVTQRLSNYCQISRKTFIISGTQEKVKKAGRKSDIGRQAIKQMRELKNDMEFALVRNQAGTAGGAATARSSAGMESYITCTGASATVATSVVWSTTITQATSAPLTSGAPAAPTDSAVGSTGAYTEAAHKLALEAAWSHGGDTDIILTAAVNKKLIDAFTGIATRNVDVGKTQQASITAAADLYVSDFGVHKVYLHRHVRNNVVMMIDSDSWAVAYLRAPFTEKLAKTGDAEKRQLLSEFCLVSRSPKANSKVVGMVA
jgi:hypothetical protein